MKHALTVISCALGMLVGTGVAMQADGTPAADQVAVQSSPAVVATTTLQPADLQQLRELSVEREAFKAAFDWNTDNRQEAQRAYASAMRDFDLRELQLKREAWQHLGNQDQVRNLDAAIEKLENRQERGHEALKLERVPASEAKEATR